jgi:FkbM family methyltransferase
MVAEQYNVDRFPNHARRLQNVYEKMLREGKKPLIIDAGANIGMSALWFVHKYPEAYIFAIEPDRDNYELLVKNTQGLGNQIIPFFGGIWSRDTRLCINNKDAGAQHYQTSETQADNQHAFDAITIEKILSRVGAESIFIAKIDIEGSQKELFRENTDWVKCTNLIVLELDDWLLPWAGTSRPFFSCVSQYPFDYLLDGENIFCFQDLD